MIITSVKFGTQYDNEELKQYKHKTLHYKYVKNTQYIYIEVKVDSHDQFS